jgi:hypothetical protein
MNDDNLSKGLKLIQDGIDVLSRGPLSYYIEKALAYREALFTRFAPFQVGDQVRLIKSWLPPEGRASGWAGSKHFLVQGAKGTVCGMDYSNGQFYADVRIDHQSWIDDKGVVYPIPPERWHTYGFAETWLEKDKGRE